MKDFIQEIRLIRNIPKNIRGINIIEETTKLNKKINHLIEMGNKYTTIFIRNNFIKRRIQVFEEINLQIIM